MRRALVTLTRQGLEDMRTATTDEEGRYVFPSLAPLTGARTDMTR